jgi:hypothetical protein
MSNDTITPQIELLQEQIESIERSGHFTEKEIDSKVAPLRMELAILQHTKAHQEFSKSVYKYGMDLEAFLEGTKAFDKCFAQMPKPTKSILDIEVIDAQILTPEIGITIIDGQEIILIDDQEKPFPFKEIFNGRNL